MFSIHIKESFQRKSVLPAARKAAGGSAGVGLTHHVGENPLHHTDYVSWWKEDPGSQGGGKKLPIAFFSLTSRCRQKWLQID